MKKFCVIFLIFAVLSPLFAQEDWAEFRWPERETIIYLASVTTENSRQNAPVIKRLRAISLNDFPKCQTCPDIHFCGMSLEGNANENSEGNPFIIPEHICTLARKTRELVHGWKRRNNALPAKV